MIFRECTKNEVFKYSKRMPRNIDKKLNVTDKDMCYFCREREREREREIHRKYRNTENIESQSAEHLWSNYNPSDLKVKSL